MRIFIQSTPSGIPKSHNFFIADQGFREMGFETQYFATLEELSGCRPDDLIVGGIGAVRGKLEEYGIDLPRLDYPEELKKYLGRRIWRSTIEQVLADTENRPVFVKPVREKRFTGMVLRKESDCPKLSYCQEGEPVICSEVVEFLREWRAFVRYGKVLDIRPYYGDWKHHFNSTTIEHAIADFTTAPAGYAMDFGFAADGRTLLVEVNDGYSLGSYGLQAIDYAKLLSARWCELVGIHDECDVFLEGYEWKNRRYSQQG
ncbi:MAG: DUF4343 domain-containing protein [Clostridiales bacterium]|nr:DUF4343 domain-containing protein [Clostridiales bacterium]